MDFKINPQDSAFMVELKMEAARNESWDREFIKDMNLAMYQKQNLGFITYNFGISHFIIASNFID